MLPVAGLAAVFVGQAACGGRRGSDDGAGGAGSSSSTVAVASSTVAVASSTNGVSSVASGGAKDCSAIEGESACLDCVAKSCCAEYLACENDANCSDCLQSQGSSCESDAKLGALDMCISTTCEADCVPKSECNPVTNENCDDAKGEACDLTKNGVFICFPAPNDVDVCGACSNVDGPFCKAGMHCSEDDMGKNGKCTHWCCSDADCGTGKCDKIQKSPNQKFPNGVGSCIGGDMAMMPNLASCDSPAMPPSGGSCYMP
jgi:hypothetical protein